MEATGIVRRIDDLGRVVIPKEVRKTMKIREGDPMEIFVDQEGEVILKKYSPIKEIAEFAQEYVDSLHETTGRSACICDRYSYIAVAGVLKKDFINRPVSQVVDDVMDSKKSIIINDAADSQLYIEAETVSRFIHEVIVPIIFDNDPVGAVILGTRDRKAKMDDNDLKQAETAALFLSKQF